MMYRKFLGIYVRPESERAKNVEKIDEVKSLHRYNFIGALVLEYTCWFSANILNIPVFSALSMGSTHVVAVILYMKRERFLGANTNQFSQSIITTQQTWLLLRSHHLQW